jgi:glycosyltransferase involved in cell wall biosynthesis/membrane-associated phospholipid phosphatase
MLLSPGKPITRDPVSTDASSVAPPPLAESWSGRSWSLAGYAVALVAAGCAAFAVDLPLSRWLVRDDGLLMFDRVIEAAEAFGHATTVILIIFAVVAADVVNRRTGPRILAASLGAGVVANLVKMIVSRSRPYDGDFSQPEVWDTFAGFLPILTGVAKGHSFPSAHVAVAAGLACALATLYPRGRTAFGLIVAAVVLQRVETGAHYLSDTLFGTLVGGIWATVLFHPRGLGHAFDRWERRGVEASVAPQEEPAPVAATLPFATPVRISSIKSLSAIIPIFNEEENVPRLYSSLVPVLDGLGIDCEIVFVNDGSSDSSALLLDELAARDSRVKVVHFRRNFGQTAAMSAGIDASTGDAVVLLDGDLQNDPTDIPMMLAKLDEGFDLIHGWRKDRHDRFLDRRLPSMIANWLISRVTGFPVHDLGCTLKVIRGDIARELRLYGEMHRFIPILAHARGAKCAEVVTKHHPRRFGVSKYGISRTVRVVMDLITVRFLTRYMVSPMRFFGQIGFVSLGLGAASGAATVAMKLLGGVDMTGNPLLLATFFGGLVGVQFFCLGVLGEVAARVYFQRDTANPLASGAYTIRRMVNLGEETPERRAA